jgi:hypothetical protein
LLLYVDGSKRTENSEYLWNLEKDTWELESRNFSRAQ